MRLIALFLAFWLLRWLCKDALVGMKDPSQVLLLAQWKSALGDVTIVSQARDGKPRLEYPRTVVLLLGRSQFQSSHQENAARKSLYSFFTAFPFVKRVRALILRTGGKSNLTKEGNR
jgi:hypothetical protein